MVGVTPTSAIMTRTTEFQRKFGLGSNADLENVAVLGSKLSNAFVKILTIGFRLFTKQL